MRRPNPYTIASLTTLVLGSAIMLSVMITPENLAALTEMAIGGLVLAGLVILYVGYAFLLTRLIRGLRPQRTRRIRDGITADPEVAALPSTSITAMSERNPCSDTSG